MPAVKRERDWESNDGDMAAGNANHDNEDGPEDEAENSEHPAGANGGRLFGVGSSSARPQVFAKGAVKLVKVHDFMTYRGTVVFRPGPRLNLVLGPNGTGKSSIVCALCIGLNGSPKTLGRADSLKDFVRRGTRAFWTEITLSSGGEGRDHVIRRNVNVRQERDTNGSPTYRYESKWLLNGREVPCREVDKLVKGLNIQFDNLCQFLPQDKVVEFARMDKYELLAATEKALGDSTLYDQHQQLIQLLQDEKQAAADRAATSTRLAKLEAEHERQRRDYERFKQREKQLDEARGLRCQAKWLEVYAKSQAAKAAEERMAECKKALRRLEDQQAEDGRPLRMREECIRDLKSDRAAVERRARQADATTQRLGEALQKHDRDMYALTDELHNLDEQARKRLADIAQARQRLAVEKEKLANAPEQPPQSLLAQVQELRASVSASRRESSELEAQRNNLAHQMQGLQVEMARARGQLDTLNSRKYQLLQRLGSFEHTRNIGLLHQFVEEHQEDGTFRGPIFGPVALEMSVEAGAVGLQPAVAGQYVENTCWHWLGSYVVTNSDDEKRLNDEARRLKVGQGVKIVATEYPPDMPFEVEYPAGPASMHARFGLLHTVDELIRAQPIVMSMLVKLCAVNSIYIGNEQAAHAMDAIANETAIYTVYVGAYRHIVIRSRYTSERSIADGELYQARLLGGGTDWAEDDAQRQELQERMRALGQEHAALESMLVDVDRQLEAAEQQRAVWEAQCRDLHAQQQAIVQKRAALKSAVESAARQLRTREAQPDPELRRPVLRQAIYDNLGRHAELCRQLVASSAAAWGAMREVQVLELWLCEATAQLAALKAGISQRETALLTARNALGEAEAAQMAAVQEMRRARDNATEHYPPSDHDKAEIKRHNEAGTAPGTLVTEAEEKEAEAERVVCNNQNVVTEYTRRQAEISHLGDTFKAQEAELQKLSAKLEEIKSSWLPDIEEMVSTINESFAANFKEIGFAGQVRLHEEEDFDKYAVEILVQFRADEGMQLLTANRQSGGERSVSTILYLIALQGVTFTPFRVVDEINQGMDPINERKVFQQLVAASTEEHTPQCFLLTPKLLPGLAYSRDITTLNIMAGPNVEDGVVQVFRTDAGGFAPGECICGPRVRTAVASA